MLEQLRHQLRIWLAQGRDSILNRPELKRPLGASPVAEDRNRPAPSLEKEIRQQIHSLAPPSQEVDSIMQAFEQGLIAWQTNPNAINHTFVLLHHPGANSYSQVATEFFKRIQMEKLPFRTLDWGQRPEPITSLAEKLRYQIGGALTVQSPEVLAIPNLSLCFLRHVEGLDGIDFMCETMLHESDRFWIVCANTICWDYLSVVTSLDACCSAPVRAYTLSGEALQSWLDPVVSEANINFSSYSVASVSSDPPQDDLKRKYFDRLAQVCEGDRIIASEVFLQSLTVQEKDETGKRLVARYPMLPSLPSLDPEDLYILYALLLHGYLTFRALAQSLGNGLIQIQPRLQKLRQAGLIQAHEDGYRVKAIHYPRLKQTLINNNFVIHEDLE